MNILAIYAHPNPKSFCHAILETSVHTMKEAGHNVRVRDLYTQKFNPVLSPQDFQAIHNGKTPADIVDEQKNIEWADAIIFIYPLWWTQMPAILKGYIDRVLLNGFAYQSTSQGTHGLLAPRKAILFHTQSTPKEVYEKIGMDKALDLVTNTGIMKFCGLQVLAHKHFDAVPNSSPAQREAWLSEVSQIVSALHPPEKVI